MGKNTSGFSFLALCASLALGLLPCIYVADALVQHYAVTDDVTQMIIYTVTVFLCIEPFGLLSLLLLFGCAYFFLTPLTWVWEWLHRPNWKKYVDEKEV